MGEERWEVDRELGLEAVRLTLTSQFPEVPLDGLRLLGHGWEFDVYSTLSGWAFRFPRRAEYVAALRRDLTVLPKVAPVMAPVLVPRVELVGTPGPHFPYPFAGHRLIPGVRADDPRVTLSPSLPAELGAALSRLHSLPPGAMSEVGPEPDESAAWLEEARLGASGLAGLEPGVDAALGWLRAAAAPPPYEGPARLVHNDLCPDHIIVGEATGGLVGIIDWTDVAHSDPILDFIVLWAWQGPAFVDRVLRHYTVDRDARFRERLRFAVRIRTLHWLAEAIRQRGDQEKHVRWVANAYS